MHPIVLKAVEDQQFSNPVPVGQPIGDPIAQARTAGEYNLQGTAAETGIWECTPGSFRRGIKEAEYSYIISGDGSFTPDGGEPLAFRSGDTLCFPPDCQGTWTIRETVRKSYVIFAR